MLGLDALVAGEGSMALVARHCSMLVAALLLVALHHLHRWLGLACHGSMMVVVGLMLLLHGHRVGLARTFAGSMLMVMLVVGLDGILHAASVVGLGELLWSALVEWARMLVPMGGVMMLLIGIPFLVFLWLFVLFDLGGSFFFDHAKNKVENPSDEKAEDPKSKLLESF